MELTAKINVEYGYDFSLALSLMKDGCKVQREGWNGKGMWIAIQQPDRNSKMSLPYIYMKTADEQLVPWLASQTDLMSCDWGVYVEEAN